MRIQPEERKKSLKTEKGESKKETTKVKMDEGKPVCCHLCRCNFGAWKNAKIYKNKNTFLLNWRKREKRGKGRPPSFLVPSGRNDEWNGTLAPSTKHVIVRGADVSPNSSPGTRFSLPVPILLRTNFRDSGARCALVALSPTSMAALIGLNFCAP